MKNQKGQTILEIVISLSVLALVLGGLVVVIINSLKNSQFSKNQAQATKLAQEGLETIRSMKSNENCYVVYGGTNYYWTTSPSTGKSSIWSGTAGTVLSPTSKYSLNLASCSLTAPTSPPQLISNTFTRTINLDQDSGLTTRIKVTSAVSWNDISGSHQSKLVTILSQ
jgi:Tfp pilus assembly protein PilV